MEYEVLDFLPTRMHLQEVIEEALVFQVHLDDSGIVLIHVAVLQRALVFNTNFEKEQKQLRTTD